MINLGRTHIYNHFDSFGSIQDTSNCNLITISFCQKTRAYIKFYLRRYRPPKLRFFTSHFISFSVCVRLHAWSASSMFVYQMNELRLFCDCKLELKNKNCDKTCDDDAPKKSVVWIKYSFLAKRKIKLTKLELKFGGYSICKFTCFFFSVYSFIFISHIGGFDTLFSSYPLSL